MITQKRSHEVRIGIRAAQGVPRVMSGPMPPITIPTDGSNG